MHRLLRVNSHASTLIIPNVSLFVPVYDPLDTGQHIPGELIPSNATGTWCTVLPSQANKDQRTKHTTNQVLKASYSLTRVTRLSVCVCYYHTSIHN